MKKIISLLLALVMILSLAACGAKEEAPDLLNIDVFADFQAESVVDDVVWAVPDLASARALYYNADILEAAGVAVPTT